MPVVLIHSTHFVIMEKSATRGRGIACPSLKGLLLFSGAQGESKPVCGKLESGKPRSSTDTEAKVFN